MLILIGILIMLHGVVHLWYVNLSYGWVQLRDAGWPCRSWLLTGPLGNDFTHMLATVGYSLPVAAFVVAGAGLMVGQSWARPWLIAACCISIFSTLLFWDGSFRRPCAKGLLGLLISAGLLLTELLAHWPAA